MTKQQITTMLGLVLILSFATLSSRRLVNDAISNSKIVQDNNNSVDGIIREAYCLHNALPEKGIVGYLVSNNGAFIQLTYDESPHPLPPDLAKTAANELMHFHLAQYALVPVIIEDNLDHQLIIGHIQNANNLESILLRYHLSVLENCKNGYILFKRLDQ